MSSVQAFLQGSFAEAVGWALVHSLWQGVLIALILYAVLRQIGDRSADLRYVVSLCALGVFVLLPVATAFDVFQNELALNPGSALASGSEQTAETSSVSEAGITTSSAAERSSIAEAIAHSAASNLQIIVLIWTAGVAFFSARLLVGWTRLRTLAEGDRPAPDHLQNMMNALADRLEIWQPLRLVQSRMVDVPTVIGWMEPVILLPVSALTGLSPQQLETILAHELAHIRRYDFAVNIVQTVVETLFFYHPATWWISRQIRIERENSCDDLAVAVCGNPLVYARALANLEQLRSSNGLRIAANGGSLVTRVRRLVSAGESRCSTRWVASLSALTLAGAVLIGAPLTLVAVENDHPSAASGTSITVLGEPVPALMVREAVEPSLEGSSGPVYLESDVLESETFVVEEADVVVSLENLAELESFTELFELEELSNGSVRIAMFGIDSADETEGSSERVEEVRREQVDELIRLKTHRVSAEYVESLRKAGYTNIPVDTLIAMSVHGVTADYIRSLSDAGLGHIRHDELVALKIHDVTPELISTLRALGYTDLEADSVTGAAIHGVSPSWIKTIHEAGLEERDLDELVGLRIHGVDASLISELKALKLPDFSTDTVVAMAIHGATPSYVREFRKLGFDRLEGDDLVAFRIHGVTARFVEEMRSAGYPQLDPDDLVAMRIHGVNAAFVEKLRKKGYTDLDVDELIELRIHGLEDRVRVRQR